MKKNTHPNYREVVYMDTSSGQKFLIRSTAQTDETIVWEDGNEYPLVKVEISSASHPFYTGKERALGTQGQIDKFYRKYGKKRAA